MKGILGAFLVVLAAAIAQAQPKSAPTTSTVNVAAFDARLEQAAAAIDDGNYDAAITLVKAAESGEQLSKSDADWAAYLKARAMAAAGNTADAEKTIRERQRAYPNSYNWASLVSILMNCGQHEEAAKAVVDLDDGDFVLANRLRPGVVEGILTALESAKSPVSDQLVAKLVENRYTGPSSQHVPDTIRLRYINLLLRQNRVEDAARETKSLESPAILSILLTDKAFGPLWEYPAVNALMAPGALVARVDRGIQARLEQTSLTASDWLDLMRSLRVIGRSDEAARLGLKAIEQARTGKRAAAPALRLEVANAYADMGESWAARRTAKELMKEQASLPVSLRVAIANVLELTGDDGGAILLISTIDGAETLSAAQKVVACAAHDLARNEKRDEALARLEVLGDAALVDRMDAYVCTGQAAKASQALISMYARPELRTTAILTSQLYADPSKAGTDLSDLRYRMRALVASNDVQEAVKAYARTLGLSFTIAISR
ncbi:MAG: hypothetical protein ABL973_10630 [Micropepsaceae bacterium]